MRRFCIMLAILGYGQVQAAELPDNIIPFCEVARPDPNSVGDLDNVLAELRTKCLPKLKRIHNCAYRTDALSAVTENAIAKFTGDSDLGKPVAVSEFAKDNLSGDFDYNLQRNFAAIQSLQKEALAAIEQFVEEHQYDPSLDKATLRSRFNTLESGKYSVSGKLVRLSLPESRFLRMIDEIVSDVAYLYKTYEKEIDWLTSGACNEVNSKEFVALLNETLSNVTTRAKNYKSYIVEARRTKNNLFLTAHDAARSTYLKQIDGQLLGEVQDTLNKIQALIRANRISDNYENWFLRRTSNFDIRMLSTRFLQFERPLRIDRKNLFEARTFRKQLELATKDFPEVFDAFVPRIDSFIKFFSKSIERIEGRGWKGTHDRQVFLAENRVIDDRFSPECREEMEYFLSKSVDIDSIESFRPVESIYFKAMQSC